VSGECLLNPLEDLGIDEQWMRTVIGLAGPLEGADVKPICQNFMNIVPAHGLAEVGLQHLAKRGRRVRSSRIEFHKPDHHG
jgi:hypothetical protein